jgi:hypothetical protein
MIATGEPAFGVEPLGEFGGAVAAATGHHGRLALAIDPQHQILAEQAKRLWPVLEHGEWHQRIPELAEQRRLSGQHREFPIVNAATL